MNTPHGNEFNAAAWLVDRHVDDGNGERVAIRCDGRATTYAQLQAELFAVQRLLAELGAAEGDRVALALRDDVAFPAWFLGAQRSGVVPIPLSTMLLGPALGDIIADSGATTLVVSDIYATALDDIVARAALSDVIIVDTGDSTNVAGDTADGLASSEVAVQAWTLGAEPDDGAQPPVAHTTADSPAFWLYSSGTTGTPKGVMHRHGSLKATVETYAHQVLQIDENDRFLSVAKLFFAYGLGNALTFPFAVGATTILEPHPPTPASMAALIAAERPTLFFASPGFAAAMLDSAPDPATFESVRASVTAGESLPANVFQRFGALTGRPVLDGIGSTELLHIFISNTLDSQTAGTSGQVVPGYEVELRDDHGAIVDAADTPGFLWVKGPSAATGYWQKPEATDAAFVDGWVRTGDVYTRSPEDRWAFLGRNNDMIKAGGIWVSPAEVESVLMEHADVMEAAVVGSRTETGLEATVAFVLPASGAQPDLAELMGHCRSRMEAFKRPHRIELVDDLPRTATGKIKRFELRDALDRPETPG